MKVVLLAGGKGTRLSEETTLRPKPMVTIGDIPILELAIDPAAMPELGITHVISGSEILNASAIGLELVDDFGRPEELGQVLLYRRLA